jgi:hypothetical protein
MKSGSLFVAGVSSDLSDILRKHCALCKANLSSVGLAPGVGDLCCLTYYPWMSPSQVGVGAFVLNEKNEVLVVQEGTGPLKGKVRGPV